MLPTKILLISADDSISHSVITSLSHSGYQVMHTSRGAGAIDLIQAEKPALIILDMELPDFNSLAIIRSLRSDELNDRTPVILMGSNMQEEDVLIELEVGADLCLLETFHPQVFVARVRSLLRRAESIRVH
jgi:DNA-binding response OmpR family regulator